MTFLAPWGLLLGALAAPLVALYFLRVRRTRLKVPSLLLWQELAKTEKLATPFQKFQRNWLLLLQLLLLALLALAMARPAVRSEAAPIRSVVLVVDTSASMGATDGSPTRLADALLGAGNLVGQLGSNDEAMLIVAGAVTEVAVPFTRDHGQIHGALNDIEVTEADGSLREGVELALSLARSRPDVEVVIFSDGGGADLADVPNNGVSVRFVPTGVGNENAGIVALDLRRSPASDLDRQLFVTVEQYGNQPVDATVEVYLDEKLVGLRTDKVTPEAPVSMVFDLPPGAEGILEARLDSPGDLLPADDRAWAVVSKAGERRVLLVGVDKLTARVLAADPRFDLQVASSAAVTPAMLATFDAAVYGGPVPEAAEGTSYLVLEPVSGGPVKFGEWVDHPSVLGWRRTHPVMRFVEWDGVVVSRAKRVADQGGLAVITEADTGALVLAGDRAGGRVVQMAFDPFETDLPLRVAWPVMVLNAVGWLTEGSDDDGARILAAGAPYVRRLPEGAPTDVKVTGPDGAVEAQISDGVLRVRDTTKLGVYEVELAGQTSTFAVNLLSPRESRIAPRGTLTLADGAPIEASQASMVGRKEIWRELLLVALGLLLLEWFAWNRRKTA